MQAGSCIHLPRCERSKLRSKLRDQCFCRTACRIGASHELLHLQQLTNGQHSSFFACRETRP